LNVFIVFHFQQAIGLEAENNPRAKILKFSSGVGMLVQYSYPLLFIIFVGSWYWGIGLFILGLIFSTTVFTLVRGYLSTSTLLSVNYFGFIGIPACIIYLFMVST
jgi:hypothetical protein